MIFSHKELVPGFYLRTWEGYTVPVEVKRFTPSGPLREITPTGLINEPASMPDAVWKITKPTP